MNMTLNNCKKETMNICRKKQWDKVPVENIWMYLTEEIGELASAIRRSTNQFSDRLHKHHELGSVHESR